MNQEDILDRQIENYIHQRMSDDERSAFEKSLAEDGDLKKQVLEILEMKLLYNKELFELKKRLNDAEGNLKNENFFNE